MTPSSRSIFLSQIFAGLGIGLLLGIIMGLSVSPVVKTILGSLSALLAAFLGLQESVFSKQAEEDQQKVKNRLYLNGIRAGSFGFATVIGLLFGIYTRTHNVFSTSIKQQVKEWTDAGVQDSLAHELVIYQKFKLFKKTGALNIDTKIAEKAAETMDPNSGFLFSKEDMLNYCTRLDVETTWNNSAANALEGYEGTDELVKTYAIELRKLEEDAQLEIMKLVKDLVCHLGNGTEADYESFCNDINNSVNYSNISESLDDISSSSNIQFMAMLAYTILNNVESDNDRISLVKAIIAILCN